MKPAPEIVHIQYCYALLRKITLRRSIILISRHQMRRDPEYRLRFSRANITDPVGVVGDPDNSYSHRGWIFPDIPRQEPSHGERCERSGVSPARPTTGAYALVRTMRRLHASTPHGSPPAPHLDRHSAHVRRQTFLSHTHTLPHSLKRLQRAAGGSLFCHIMYGRCPSVSAQEQARGRSPSSAHHWPPPCCP